MSSAAPSSQVWVACDEPGCSARIYGDARAAKPLATAILAADRAGWALSAFGAPEHDICPACIAKKRAAVGAAP